MLCAIGVVQRVANRIPQLNNIRLFAILKPLPNLGAIFRTQMCATLDGHARASQENA